MVNVLAVWLDIAKVELLVEMKEFGMVEYLADSKDNTMVGMKVV